MQMVGTNIIEIGVFCLINRNAEFLLSYCFLFEMEELEKKGYGEHM